MKTENKKTASLYDLTEEEWKRGIAALEAFDMVMDVFLLHWMYRMKAAGYLDFTTAKKQDCITACYDLLDPVFKHGRNTPFLPLKHCVKIRTAGQTECWSRDSGI